MTYWNWSRRVPVRTQQSGARESRRFEIVADLTPADERTLEVYYDPDDIHISVELNDGRLCERTLAVPSWADTKGTTAVLNNGILTVTVSER